MAEPWDTLRRQQRERALAHVRERERHRTKGIEHIQILEDKNSGATYATGFDTGHWSIEKLAKALGADKDGLTHADLDIIEKLDPILGYQRGVTDRDRERLQRRVDNLNPLTVNELQSMDNQVLNYEYDNFVNDMGGYENVRKHEQNREGMSDVMFGNYYRGAFTPEASELTWNAIKNFDYEQGAKNWWESDEFRTGGYGGRTINPVTWKDTPGVINRYLEQGNMFRGAAGQSPYELGKDYVHGEQLVTGKASGGIV